MKMFGRAALSAAVITAASAALAAPTTGPVAVYWMSADTSSGMMAGMMGANGRPSGMGMMGMMMGGGPNPNAVNHTLRLQLGSYRHPQGDPSAEHDPPPGLGAGPVLPLVTPQEVRSEPEEQPRPPQQFQRPNGRLLIYWGCGEHARPGQPVVIDFAKISADPQGYAGLMRGMISAPMQPPSAGRYPTYGEWPNTRSRTSVPAQGSLVGDHTVRGDYTPDIHFTLGSDQDFMAPLRLTNNAQTPSGSVQLAWDPVPTALGYFASVMGSQGGDTMVMWTSSNAQTVAFAAADYLPPSETRRLVAAGQVLSPQTTACTVPVEVARQAQGLVSLVAYGDEANFAYPPRPAPPLWTVKVRYRSSTSGLLGQPSRGGYGGGGYGQQQQQQQQNQGGGGFFHGLGGLIP